MKAASWPRDDRASTRLMVLDHARDDVAHATTGELGRFLRRGDVLVVNDAATVPASLAAVGPLGEPMEVRLAGPTARTDTWHAVLFGEGDWRTRTESRPPPPPAEAGDALTVGALRAVVRAVSPLSPRLVELAFEGGEDRVITELYGHGRPVQYAHVERPLPLFHVQTAYAGPPWAVEQPSAGRPLTWQSLCSLAAAGVALAWVTHAAGLSSTGDAALDAALPLPERSRLPAETLDAIARARAAGGRVVAVGTSVVRALEGNHAAHGALVAGEATIDARLGAGWQRRVVDAVLSGIHEEGTSHFELLTSFLPREHLLRGSREAEREGYLGHELGDACLVVGPAARGGRGAE